MPGVSSLATPVFDGRGAHVRVLTAIGPSATFDIRPDGAIANALYAAAGGLPDVSSVR